MKAEVEKRLAEFKKVKKVGEGTYGEVYEAIDLANNNRRVAMKNLHIENKDEGIPITALREMCILKHLHHENIVDLYEIIQDVDKIVLIFECADMDLRKYLDKEKEGIKDIKLIQSFVLQILNGLYYCNINRIIHRDLKPQNLLITNDLKLKLCDFGLSRMFSLPMGKMTHEIIQDVDKIVLIFECADMDLKKYLDKEKGGIKDIKLIQSFVLQILNGLYYCNINRIIHRDLKPQNLLITNDLKLKLCDFGLSRMFSLPMGKMTHEIITLWYRPPEVLLGIENYTTKVDSWSIGCIMAEMINGKPLFPGDSEIGQLFQIFKTLGTPNEEIWPGVSKLPEYKMTFPQWKPQSIKAKFKNFDKDGLDLMDKFLQMDPEKRITIREALNHPFITRFRDEEGINDSNE